jgi:hypothetical protein
MPLTKKGRKIHSALTEEYGAKKGESVFYAMKNAGKISGVDAEQHAISFELPVETIELRSTTYDPITGKTEFSSRKNKKRKRQPDEEKAVSDADKRKRFRQFNQFGNELRTFDPTELGFDIYDPYGRYLGNVEEEMVDSLFHVIGDVIELHDALGRPTKFNFYDNIEIDDAPRSTSPSTACSRRCRGSRAPAFRCMRATSAASCRTRCAFIGRRHRCSIAKRCTATRICRPRSNIPPRRSPPTTGKSTPPATPATRCCAMAAPCACR